MNEFSVEQLINLAGEQCYNRGDALFQAGAVRDWQQQQQRITASVYDTAFYQVSLTITSKGIDGACDCPVSEGFEFCEHCVATALSVRQSQAEAANPEQASILAYLNNLPKSTLISQFAELIQADPRLQRHMLRQAQIASNTLDISTLRKQITQALPYRKVSQRRAIRSYFSKACSELSEVSQYLDALPAETALQLCEYALERIHQVSLRFDGQGLQQDCAELICQQYADQILRLSWPAEKLAGYLTEQLQQPREVFPDLLSVLANSVVLPELISQAKQIWQQHPDNRNISELLQSYAAEHGDADLQLQLLQKAPETDSEAVLQLIRHLLIQLGKATKSQRKTLNQQLQTLFTALQAPAVILDQQQQRQLQQLQVEASRYSASPADAAEQYWQLFISRLSPASYLAYQRLITEQGGSAEQAQQRAEAYLLEQARQNSQLGHQALARSHEQLFEFYLTCGLLHKARIIADQLTLSPAHLEALASELLVTDVNLSQQYYQRLLDDVLQEASDSAYMYVCEILQQLKEYEPLEVSKQLLQTLLSQLQQQHKHKRSFIRLLEQHFGN